MKTLIVALLVAHCGFAQDAVTIRVHANDTAGPFKPIYAYFGYDEPNYTYAENGRKLVGELAAVSSSPVYIRTHFMLATGNGTPSLKFGSTNAYTEDASGKPVYDWTITDRIFDTYLRAGAKPFAEIGFMPEALSSKPDPYFGGEWVPGAPNKGYYAGWSYPPKDYKKWGELVYQWVSHCVQKYGAKEVSSWYWEVWNEPDISYWHGTPEEYDQLYDFAAAAVKRALPGARVGGPASTSPASPKAAAFLRQFLQHCATEGAPLDFVTFHAKGQPKVIENRVQMGIAKNARDADAGVQILSEFPAFRDLPVVLSESDPEGCAACSARVYPQNAYRNGPLYAAYTAAMLKTVIEINERRGANIAGMLTWAFEFENQPWFDGFRTLATNGVDKPVLNLFRMAGLMQGDWVRTESDSAVPLEDLLTKGVSGKPDVDALAVRSDRRISVLAWNYHDDDVPAPAAGVRFVIQGVPAGVRRVLLRHYRIDETHSNSWTAWKHMGSPQHPTPEQFKRLESAGQLQLLESPRWIDVDSGSA
ncbi:MAG: glycoside hydrolase, family 39, partial [Bryobacterales bacterium]|nr:glycoside hydrolase, family 39 [Bryobacterales bacterium]